MRPQVSIRFEDFELDPERYELRRAGQIQKLEKIPMELLLLLAGRPGILVSRKEIAEIIWGPAVFVESERGINTAMGKIRRVLEDDPDHPRYVQTVVGKGYRFIAQVRAEPIAGNAPPGLTPVLEQVNAPALPVNDRERHKITSIRQWRKGAAIAAGSLALLAAALIATNAGGLRDWLAQPFSPKIRSVAVLPMANLANDPAEEYFVDGMTDQLITNLAQSTSLRVISRTSIMQLKNVKKSLPEIAHLLNVDAVVEGSVMRYNNQLKIEAQLLDARRDRHLWAQTYEGRDDDVLALQDEVTRDIAEHVAATLRPQTGRAGREDQHVSAEAYENYLRGRYFLAKRNPEALRKAIEYFQKAIEIDQNNALAYVGLADTYNVISFYGGPPPSESFPKAEAAARKALSLDGNLGEAHAALGDTLFSYHWDWSGAEREFQEAIAINPGNASAHHWYSELLSVLGRHDEAIEQIEQAKQLDPLSRVINITVAGALYLARRFDEAEKQIKATLDLDPNYGPAHGMLGWICLCEHKNAQAVLAFKRAMALSGNSPSALAALGCAYAGEGDYPKARSIAAELETRSKHQYVSPETLARLYVSMRDKNAAIERLEEAYRTHVDTLNNIYVEPCYDSLRSDPRFQSLIKRMNFVR